MKRTLITSITILFITVLSFAQPPGGQGRQFDREEMVKRQTEQMVEDLNLNEDQAQKVKKLNEKYGEKMGEIFQNNQGGGDFEQMREKMEEMREAKNAELKEILTEEQFEKYQKQQEERMNNRSRNGDRPERRGSSRGDE